MNKLSKWDCRHFLLAMHVATWSKDPETRVGAVVVGKDRREISLGYNGFPPGVSDDKSRVVHRPTKYLFTQHAERNAMDNARFDCTGGTLITTMFPCVECAKSLVSKGIRRLVTAPIPPSLPNGEKSWRDTIPYAITIMEECSVEITEVPPYQLPGIIPG